MKQQKFPMAVKCGNVSVKIYRQKSRRGYTTFTVSHYEEDGMLQRFTIADFEDAKSHADETAERLNRGDGFTLMLEGADRLVYARAMTALEPLKIPLDLAASEYASAVQLLHGRGSIQEAVRCFIKRQGEPVTFWSVKDVVVGLIVTREKARSSIRHIKDLRSSLDRFARSFHCDISSVAAADIQDFLLALKLAPKTVNNFRTAISNLFSFSRLKRYIAKDFKPLEEVKEVKEPEKEVGIYTPAEVQRL